MTAMFPRHATSCFSRAFLVLLLGEINVTLAYITTVPVRSWTKKCSSRHAALPESLLDSSTLMTAAVDVFDGSTIVDPVVVSDVFWTSLQAKMLSVVIGQVLAAIVFVALTSVAASQIQNLTSFVTTKLFNKDNLDRAAGTVTEKARTAATDIEPDFGKLVICIVIDVIGSSSELIPLFGELTDVVWAPIAGTLLKSLYGSNVLFVLEFAEEILPFTDILPLATICWVVDTYFGDTDLAKTLGLGGFSPAKAGKTDIIDVDAERDIQRRLPGDSDYR